MEDATRRRRPRRHSRAHTRHAHGSFLSHFSPPRSLVFRTRLRRDLPQTNHEKKREEKRAVRPRRRRGRAYCGERMREKGTERECVRAHTRPRGCNTRMTRRRAADERRKIARGTAGRWQEGGAGREGKEGARAERSLFFVLFFIVR